VSLSRDQLVDVQVISYLDFTVVIGALAAIALMLLLVGRPLLRRRVRRLAAGPLRRARAVTRR
jgi:membrane protein implicated in regulation of membrane protease activity